MAVHLFGIRHHGPGSARSLLSALQQLKPDALLVEGPPDAEAIIPLVSHADMKPPVAILVYAPTAPARAVYYPFALFSPEWQALRFASKQRIPVRFIDLPIATSLALEREEASHTHAPDEQDSTAADTMAPSPVRPSATATPPTLHQDPLLHLAQAAGYSDSERWWEHLVEERRDGTAVFQAIAEAMVALRKELGDHPGEVHAPALRREQLREASMRTNIRAAMRAGHTTIAVVCGAWHVPALLDLSSEQDETALFRGLPTIPTEATWIPWTHGRLQAASGYGAGVRAPGWYQHLWATKGQVSIRWMVKVAHLLRERGMDVSSAHLIEAVRLAETVAAMAGRPQPGLEELTEATQAVLLFGDALPLQLIEQHLIVGETLGEVPEETPAAPLAADLRQQQKRLRLKAEATDRDLILDLRQSLDLERSSLFRRLQLLGIPWGKSEERVRGKGTFKESWRLRWQPEFSVTLIEAGVWGNTIRDAAVGFVIENVQRATTLPALTALTEQVLFADLPEAVGALMIRLQAEAAVASDMTHLMGSVPELARLLRYGDVRQTDTEVVAHVVNGLVSRICVGLPNACQALNEDAAEHIFAHLQAVHEALVLLDNDAYLSDWYRTLHQLADSTNLQGILQGRCCRLLLDGGIFSDAETAQRFSLALSTASEPAQAAAWIDGFLRQSGQILIHDERLWRIIDSWLTGLPGDAFLPLLPLLRRTFSTFTMPERRQMGERVRKGGGPTTVTPRMTDEHFDHARAEAVLPLLAKILGLEEQL